MAIVSKITVFETHDGDVMLALAPGKEPDQMEVYYSAAITEWRWCQLPAVLKQPSVEPTAILVWLQVTNPYVERENALMYFKVRDDTVKEERWVETVFYRGRSFRLAVGVEIDLSTVVDIPDDREVKYLAEEKTKLHPPKVVVLTVSRWQPDDVSTWRLYDGTWDDFSQVSIQEPPIESYGKTHVQIDAMQYVFSPVSGGGRMFQLLDGEMVLNYRTALWLKDPSDYHFQEEDGHVRIVKK